MSKYISRSSFVTTEARELEEKKPNCCLALNPWTVQTIVYEIIQDYMVNNNPKDNGYTFEQVYDPDKTKSQISLQIAYDWKSDTASKRPAIFINRGDAAIRWPTMHQMVGSNPVDSEHFNMGLISIPISVIVVASPIGFVEQLADYVKQPLMYYAQLIQQDFGFARFRLNSIGKPQIYVEAKDNFAVDLNLQIEFSDSWVVRGDHLKLKTFSAKIFDRLTQKPLENQ